MCRQQLLQRVVSPEVERTGLCKMGSMDNSNTFLGIFKRLGMGEGWDRESGPVAGPLFDWGSPSGLHGSK